MDCRGEFLTLLQVTGSSVGWSGLQKSISVCKRVYDGQHGFRPGYSRESQVVTVCQDIADSMDEGVRIDAIITDFFTAFDLVQHDRLLTKIAATGVDLRVFVYG